MDESGHRRVHELFEAAVDMDPEARRRLLDEACAGQAALRAEVERLLALDGDEATDFLRRAPALDAGPASGEADDEVDDDDEDLRPGATILGQYRIIRPIGRGGMGRVFEAQQFQPPRRVALKVILESIASRAMLARFRREIRALARLHHPGIATIFGSGVLPRRGRTAASAVDGPGRPFSIMELVEGLPLTGHATRHDLSLAGRLDLAVQLCDAVQHAHEQGIVHRDLKPANVLVQPDGQVKVLDFGIARFLPGATADLETITVRTGAGELIGTLPYMSPEQLAGDPGRIDAQCDVYAIGVLLHELLTGQLPFDVRGRSIAEAARIICEEDPAPLSSIRPGLRSLRGDIETIVQTAIEKDRTRRYPTAAALAGDLRRHLRREPISARPPSALYRLSKFAHRNRGLVAGVALAFVVLLAGLAGTSWLALVAARERNAALWQEAQADAARRSEADQRARAERRFEDVRTLAGTFIFEVEESIRDLPGATASRQLLVSTGLRYLDALAEEVGDEPGLMREIALAYGRLGDVQGDMAGGNLGDLPGAIESYDKAVRMAARRAAAGPDDPDAALELASLTRQHAAALRSAGRREEAMALYASQVALLRDLAQAHPARPDVEESLVLALADMGRMYADVGRLADAIESLAQYERYVQGRIEAGRTRANDRRNRVVVLGQMARMHQGLGRSDEAERLFRTALDAAMALHADHAGSVAAEATLGGMHRALGLFLVDTDRIEEARTHLAEDLRIRAALAAADPEDLRALRHLGIAHYALGHAFLRSAQYEAGLAHWQAFAETSERGLARTPDYTLLHLDLAIALRGIGTSLRHLGHLEEALAVLRRRVTVLEPFTGPGADTAFVRELAIACEDLAQCLLAAADDPGADEVDAAGWRTEAAGAVTRSTEILARMREAGVVIGIDEELEARLAELRARLPGAMIDADTMEPGRVDEVRAP